MPTREELEIEMEQCRLELRGSDYKTMKYIEGELSDEDYEKSCVQRSNWRARINRIQEMINNGEYMEVE